MMVKQASSLVVDFAIRTAPDGSISFKANPARLLPAHILTHMSTTSPLGGIYSSSEEYTVHLQHECIKQKLTVDMSGSIHKIP